MTLQLLTVDDVAARLQVSRATVYRMHARGDLPGVRLGVRCLRFSPADVERCLRGRSNDVRLVALPARSAS